MKTSISKLAIDVIIIIILISFSLPAISKDIIILVLAFISLLFIAMRHKTKFPKYMKVRGFVLIAIYAVGYLFADHSQNFGIISSITILSVAFISENFQLKPDKDNGKIDIIYFCILAIIIFYVLTSTRSDDGSLVFRSIGDKNYSAIFLYMFFLYSNKRNKLGGVLISIILGLIAFNSRSLLLLMALFYVCKILSAKIYTLWDKIHFSYFKFMIFLFCAVMILSFVWVSVVSINTVAEHYGSLNDAANKIRFTSNIRTFQLLFENWKENLLWGYGYDYTNVLGVDVTFSQLPVYMGTKIMQAHNSYLSMIVQMGLIPGLIYFFILGKILDKIAKKNNIEYIFPFLVNACLMHSLLNGIWIFFLISILLMPQSSKGYLTKVYWFFNVKKWRKPKRRNLNKELME